MLGELYISNDLTNHSIYVFSIYTTQRFVWCRTHLKFVNLLEIYSDIIIENIALVYST